MRRAEQLQCVQVNSGNAMIPGGGGGGNKRVRRFGLPNKQMSYACQAGAALQLNGSGVARPGRGAAAPRPPATPLASQAAAPPSTWGQAAAPPARRPPGRPCGPCTRKAGAVWRVRRGGGVRHSVGAAALPGLRPLRRSGAPCKPASQGKGAQDGRGEAGDREPPRLPLASPTCVAYCCSPVVYARVAQPVDKVDEQRAPQLLQHIVAALAVDVAAQQGEQAQRVVAALATDTPALVLLLLPLLLPRLPRCPPAPQQGLAPAAALTGSYNSTLPLRRQCRRWPPTRPARAPASQSRRPACPPRRRSGR